MSWWSAMPDWARFVVAATGVIVVFVVASGFAMQARKRRGQALAGAGSAFGLAYSSTSDDLRSSLARLPLFSGSGRHRCEHVLARRDADGTEALFEYTYLAGRQDEGERERPNRGTSVYACRIPGAGMPAFVAEPRSAVARRAAALTDGGDVHDADPGFTPRFDLLGEDAPALKRWFDRSRTAAVAGLRDGWTHRIEAHGEWVLVVAADRRLEANDIGPLLDDGRAAVRAIGTCHSRNTH